MQTVKDAIWVFLDNEGPQTKNDNAQENMVTLAKEYPDWDRVLPEVEIVPLSKEEEKMTVGEIIGTRTYQRISNIDDIWGDFHRIPKDPSYSSGHTLKVVLPFYKAMGATSQWLYDFAKDSLLVVPNIGRVLVSLDAKYNVWQISTSYEFFIKAFCNLVSFDFSRARCTFVERFDEIPISNAEAGILLAFLKWVALTPVIEYDGKTGEVKKEHQACYDWITGFIWEVVYHLPVGKFLRIVHPVGQAQKREAVEEICRECGVSKEKVMVVDDSQTGVQIVEWLRGVGLTMMFNGKGRICSLSDIMYIGEDARAIEEVADLFAERGRQGVIDYYTPPREAKCGGLLAAVTPENIGELEPMSVKKRKEFRGVAIGELT